MAPTSEAPAFDLGVPPMPDNVLPEKTYKVIGFRADLEPRIEEFARRSTEAELSEVERAEYAGYVRANKFVAILNRQCHQFVNCPS